MFINNKKYNTDGLSEVAMIRNTLYENFYSKISMIEKMQELIEKNLDCKSVKFDNNRYLFIIELGDKLKGKNNTITCVNFLNHAIAVYKDFINYYKPMLIDDIKAKYGEANANKCLVLINSPNTDNLYPICDNFYLDEDMMCIRL